MHRKTVHLDDSYTLLDDGSLAIAEYGDLSSVPTVSYRPSVIQRGAELTLVSRERLSGPGRGIVTWHLQAGPIAGNSAPRIKRYHGWRGTTDDVFVEAHGVRRVLRVRALKNNTVAVTVGADLHPEWP